MQLRVERFCYVFLMSTCLYIFVETYKLLFFQGKWHMPSTATGKSLFLGSIAL
jgi:hypothetical protein